MSDELDIEQEHAAYHFEFTRTQYGFLILGSAFICFCFFILGFKLGQRYAAPLEPAREVTVIRTGPESYPTAVPVEESAESIGGSEGIPADPTEAEDVYVAEELDTPPTEVLPATKPPTPTKTPTPIKPATTAPTKAPPTKAPATKIPATAKPASKPPAKGTIYAVQVGAFGDEANARRRKDELVKLGFPTRIVKAGTMHRVLVGEFDSREAMTKGLEALQAMGYECIPATLD